MSRPQPAIQYYICPICAYRNEAQELMDHDLDCQRCGHKVFRIRPYSNRLTFMFSLTALIFYIPANVFPFMTIELYGNRNSATIWQGVTQMAESGSIAIAILVFLASILIPLCKLVVLFYLSATAENEKHLRFKMKLYDIVEAIGRWSMLDIFLLAILIAVVKLGHWTTVKPESGSLMFAFVVIFTMFASASFDPQLIWRKSNEKLVRSGA